MLEFMVSPKMIVEEGSVRVDLLGGTLDLNPINLILPHVVTLNLATSLKAKVKISEIDFDGVEIHSHDYHSTHQFESGIFTEEHLRQGTFGPLTFIARLLHLFKIDRGVKIELESGSPPGAGLGGSSAMGVTTFKALTRFLDLPFDKMDAFTRVNSIEAMILDSGPAGYQDYFPALYGGVLAIRPHLGSIDVEQIYTDTLKEYLEDHVTLVYSGETRMSGINNWEVYKAFFNKDADVRRGLQKISELSYDAYLSIKSKDYKKIRVLIKEEGEERRKLFPYILTPQMNALYEELPKDMGMKVCGAGGGGCFLILHEKDARQKVNELIQKYQMHKMEFKVEKPLWAN